jgi:PPK2 family polyphosphate:nucleotide phosphotransferase
VTDHSRFSTPFAVTDGRRFRLRDVNPEGTLDLRSKAEAAERLDAGIERLRELQELLYAQDRWGLLVIFQAMDAAGKDSIINHVMSGVNPQGVDVSSFKAPSADELDHDFMWRCLKRMPERGRIGVFNRSYYEEALVVRVHQALLGHQHLPPALVTPRIWEERFEDINAIERYLGRNGVVIRKFFLHVSRREQKQRFMERLDEPAKHWKFEAHDVRERQHWDEYMAAYEEAIRQTATPVAPWYVVPADSKWVTRLVVADAIVETLEGLGLQYPVGSAAERKALAEARKQLEEE